MAAMVEPRVDAALPTPQPAPPRRRFARVTILVGLALALLVQAWLFGRTTSAVWDESIYLGAGLRLFHRGSMAPLINSGIAPLPVLATQWLPAMFARGDRLQPADFARAVRLARAAQVVVVGLPLVLLPFWWMARRRGLLAASTAGAMLAFSPSLVAFSAVATTDACLVVCSLAALAALARYVRTRSAPALALAGVAAGLALAAKYTALFLVPVAWVALTAVGVREAERSCRGWTRAVRLAAARTAVLAAIAFLLAWAMHGFAVAPVFDADFVPPPSARGPIGQAAVSIGRALPFPAPVKGIVGQALHVRGGQAAFLVGERSTRGWWYYFPLALLFKSTPAELLLAAALPFLLWFARRELDASSWLAILSMLVFAASLLTSRLDIGIRYALILYPLVVLLAIDCAAALGRPKPRALAALAAGFVLLQVASAAGAAPRQLSYFNRLFTPPGEGYTRLVDSNLDWGQDLPALGAALASRGTDRALLAYFGTAPPQAYGIRAVPWDSPDDAAVRDCRWVAVSATLLNGVYLRRDPLRAFRRLRPAERMADSIFLYDGARADVQAALAAARSMIPLQPGRPATLAESPDDPLYGVVSHWRIR
jgi:4-amino-4-deoxy-L-arabinose transferase-like glycosyltransferase